MPSYGSPGRRVAIVAGVRTPFAKSGTTLKNLTAIELGKHCVAELIQRSEIDGKLVEIVVYGTVVPSVVAPNIAREVSLLPMLPKGVQSFTVSRACAPANRPSPTRPIRSRSDTPTSSSPAARSRCRTFPSFTRAA